MNKFVIGALAITSAGSLAYAGGDETREWSTLDRDILSLTSNQGTTAGSFGINGFVRSRGAHSNDVDANTAIAGQQDLSGFVMDNARLELNASQGDYGVVLWLEAAGGVATLLDAYGTFKIAEGVTGQVGQFRAPFLWSSFMVDDNNLVLLDRTFNGQVWQNRDNGVQLSGVYDMFSWWAALQNGADGSQNEYMWTARAQFNFLGSGVGKQEGAFGATGNETNIMVGASYSDDAGVSRAINQAAGNQNDAVNSGAAWGLDAGLTQGALSLHVEVVDYEGDIRADSGLNSSTGVINPLAVGVGTSGQSETPWSATAGYMLQPDVCEVIVRYEDLDDVDNTIVWTVGLNYYIPGCGHNAKWTIQGSRSDSDLNAKEADTAAIGLCVGV